LSDKINYLVGEKDWNTLNSMTRQIDNNLFELSSILDNLLPWVASQIKNPKLNKSKIALEGIIDITISEMAILSKGKEMDFINECKDSHKANVDEESMRIVLRNLLKNAIKFSNRGGSVYIKTIDKKDFVELHIVDEGIGMSDEVKKNIFLEYKSAKGTAGEIGYGLGLKLSKDLVISNGVSIKVISELGQGTTVKVDLPKK